MPVDQGLLVAQLYPGGPADAAGIQGPDQEIVLGNHRFLTGGDIITAVNGQPVKGLRDFLEYLELNTEVGDIVTLTILRGDAGTAAEIEITLIAQP